ncbi:endonuclease/exonuclease/phosphatase family protein [Clostridium algidicarnis]|uniref:endonuclease/exonuclease/phosphatase family protein n=1 Tax=Clostridium algidicarnis TaxID=37659 RepID=UPI001C0B6B18|nr:endonuclease/exonuclease/phosphatase family protein [Clostridium algidicarnis]MBU3209674.1 endonuclease/exonuclease/phosphatase family protein [Clostridium algidicarnis]
MCGKKIWLFRSESEPGENEIKNSQLIPLCDLMNEESINVLEQTLSGSARAVAKKMAEDFLKVSKGDFLLLAYKENKSFLELAEVKGDYEFTGNNHSRRIKIFKRIDREKLPGNIKNKVLRMPRIIADISGIENVLELFEGRDDIKEVDVSYPLRGDYSMKFSIPHNITKSECLRMGSFFYNLWPIGEKNINIFEWNVNQSCLSEDKEKQIPNFVFNIINGSQKAVDIFVLLEVFNIKGHIKNYRKILSDFELYFRNIDPQDKKNEILIGVRKNSSVFKAISYEEFEKITQLSTFPSNDNPNSLRVDVEILSNSDKKLSIIGTRIRVEDDWKKRAVQFENLMKYTKELVNVAIMGDFNHGAIKEEWNDEYQYNKPRSDYNYQFIKKNSKSYDLKIYTPDKGVYGEKWSFVMKEKKIKIKLDHILTKNVGVTNIYYSWSFLDYLNVYQGLKAEDYKYAIELINKPDHAILTAELEL